jgi:hypothetical protein
MESLTFDSSKQQDTKNTRSNNRDSILLGCQKIHRPTPVFGEQLFFFVSDRISCQVVHTECFVF